MAESLGGRASQEEVTAWVSLEVDSLACQLKVTSIHDGPSESYQTVSSVPSLMLLFVKYLVEQQDQQGTQLVGSALSAVCSALPCIDTLPQVRPAGKDHRTPRTMSQAALHTCPVVSELLRDTRLRLRAGKGVVC